MKDLSSGNIYKNMMLFAIPLVLSGLLSQGFNLVDTVIAGQFLGTDGLAAIGATSAYLTFASSVIWGLSAGLGMYLGQLFGAKKYSEIRSVFRSNAVFLLLAILLITSVSVIFSDAILTFLNVDASIYKPTKTYFLIYSAGLGLILFNNVGVHTLNAYGSSTYPLYVSISSAVINIVGNILSVTVLGLGVAGIALFTVVAAGVGDVLFYIKIMKTYREMGVIKENPPISFAKVKETAGFTLPSSFQQSVMYVSRLAISPIVNGLGSAATASYAVVLRIYNVCGEIYFNSVKSLQVHTAQSIGAGKLDRAKKGLAVGTVQNAVLVTPMILACVFLAKPIAMLFFRDDADPVALAYTLEFMRFFVPFTYFNLLGNVFHGFFKALGARRELIGATSVGSAVQLVASILFAHFMGMRGVFIGWAISWIADAGCGFLMYRLGYWKKRIRVLDHSK